MGWGKRGNATTDRHNLKGGGGQRLVTFEKKGVVSTVSVAPGTVNAGAVSVVAISVPGARVRRWHRVIAVPPDALEAGLRPVAPQITGTDTATISVENFTGAPIVAIARNWNVHLFRRRA